MMSCSGCGGKSELVNREEVIIMRGKQVTYVAEFYQCMACGLEFEFPGMLDKNLEAARKVFHGA